MPYAAPPKVITGFEARLPAIVAEIVRRSRADVMAYASVEIDPELPADHARHAEEIFRVLVRCLADRRPPTLPDFAFMHDFTRRRVEQGIALADFLHTFRIGQMIAWEAMVDAVADSGEDADVALAVVAPLMEFINVATTAAAEAFLDAERLLSADGDRTRRDLLEGLLARRYPAPGAKLAAARAAGLVPATSIAVISAARLQPGGEAHELSRAATVLAHACGLSTPPLAVVRDNEAIIVAPVTPRGLESLSGSLADAGLRLAADGVRLAVGVSTLHVGLRAVPEAYEEACTAREHVGPRAGVLSLASMSPFDYLTSSDQGMLHRLIRPDVHRFVKEDRASGGGLCETLLAYVDAGLHATGAAEQLHVHVNTVQYRLRRISEKTGCDLRKVPDVVELVLAIRPRRGLDDG